ncbi:PQQ-dependent sugar dehydrogenase [Mycolicibacterium chubuense]|uniref:Quinoprotein glucose dehydrogenase B n=1 Tax=Mycolicibacterium chubuense TaxID=1800 RepID=A0A0J6YIP4_MYCCU|nr:PQQ-dependent sugar dehydrogenase [Mycolicibacterium chubuense]KMO72751.1 Quinoprotein glucose dehydrogenase B precursor [Mycolicibacterium chubuense]SPX99743.1 glucose/sorbosone dehydrogenase [Mycolicibacterium chubuense]
MGSSALHIGRVGGLAVALGIGAAVLTGQAIASAETGDTSTSTNAAAASPDSASPAAGPRIRRGAADDKPTASERATRRAEVRAQRAEARAERAADRSDRVEQRRQRTIRVTSPAPTEPTASATAADPLRPRDRAAGLLDVVATGLAGAGARQTTQATAAAVPDRTVVAAGLNQPTDFRFLPDGRILVAEKGGRIRIVEDGAVQRRPLYRVFTLTQGERGLGALTVDPDFETNGYIYVAYTTIGARDRLARLTVRGDRVVFGSQKVLLQTTDPSAFYHHGGALGFGPDGALYWGVGDNKNSDNAQDLGTIHGKVIRINPDGTIPSDNPDLGAGALPQIYAYGFRNPFRLSFTPDGTLLVADVGENSFEEVDNVIAGGNYGWPGSEGNCTSNCAGSINPIYAYSHDGEGASITSVLYYTGGQLGSEFQNTLLIADFIKGWIKALDCTADFSSCGNPRDFDAQAGQTVLLAQGPGGALYQLDYGSGRIVRIGATSVA